MATLDDSPSLYLGQPWSIWADKIEGKHKEGSTVKSEHPVVKDDTNTMKLRIEDMPLFGLCPSRDEFFLVVCEHCKQVVKPQALKSHIELRHSRVRKPSTWHVSPVPEASHAVSSRHDTHGKTPPRPPIGPKGGTKNKLKPGDRISNHALPSLTVDIERMPSPVARQPGSFSASSTLLSRSNSKPGASSSNGPLDDDSLINSRVAMQVASPPGGGVTGMTAHKSPPHMGVFLHPKPAPDRHLDRSQRLSSGSTSDREKASHDKSHSSDRSPHGSDRHSYGSDRSHVSDRHHHASERSERSIHGSERSIHAADRSFHASERSSHNERSEKPHSSERQSHGSEKSHGSRQLEHSHGADRHSTDRSSHSDRSHSSDKERSHGSEKERSYGSDKERSYGSEKERPHASEKSSYPERSSHTTTATTTTITTTTSVVGQFTSISRPSQLPVRSSTTTSLATGTTASSASTTVTSTSPATAKSKSKAPKPSKCIPCKDREFDPDVHCGVIIADTGKPCTRSLTCKGHALSLRRAVQGRCKPFDDLLREHREAKEKLIIQKYAEKGLPVPPKLLPSKKPSSGHHNSSSHSSKTETKQSTSPRQAPSLVTTAAVASTASRTPTLTSSPPVLTSPSATTKITKPPMLPSPTPVGMMKEEPIPETCSRVSSDGEEDGDDDKDDLPYRHIPYHPRPAAVNNFGSRLAGSGCFVFNRRSDLLRAAFMVAVEQHLHPPPHKKLCLESRLPQGSQITTNAKDPYEFPAVGDSSQHQGRVANKSKHRTNSSSSASSPGRYKSRDGSGGRSPASSSSSLSLASSLNSSGGLGSSPKQANGAGNGHLKRKRPSSSSSPGVTLSSPTSTLPGLTALTNPISIAIPTGSVTVNLSSSTLSHLSLGKAGQLQAHKNHLPKDLNIVVTNMDPSLMNGQILTSTGLTGQAGEVVKLQLNSLAEKTSNAKRARLNASQVNSVGVKLAGSVDGGVLNIPQMMFDPQGAVFTPVSIATMSHAGVSLNNMSPTHTSPSSPPSPLFSSGSTSPQTSATSPLANGVVSSPSGTGMKTLPVNHVAGAMSVSPLSNHSALSPNPLEASQPAAPRHHRGSGGSSRSSMQKAAASMQQVMVSVSGGTSGLPAGTYSLAGQAGGRLIPTIYTSQMLAPNSAASQFPHIQIQPKQTVGNGQAKTVATGKLAMQPVSLTIPLMTQPTVAMAQPQSQTARLLLQSTGDERHRHRHHDLQAQVQTSPS